MIFVGISGWTYAPWRGRFYPEGLKQRDTLAYASRQFGSIEVNGTFYRLQAPANFRRWHDETRRGFIFAVKANRYITHARKLRGVEPALANFFASGPLALGEKLGPILWQFPDNFRFDPARFGAFLELLPRDTEAAALLAQRHERRLLRRGACLEAGRKRRLRHAFEVRHDSFLVPEFVALLRRHRVAAVIADAPDWPLIEDVTADFLYLRLHGAEELYRSGYDGRSLDRWAMRIRRWAAGREPRDARRLAGRAPARPRRDVYVYFDNDAKVRAPVDAKGLMARLRLGPARQQP